MSLSIVQNETSYELDGKRVTPKIIKVDLDQEIVKFSIESAIDALKKYSVEKDLAEYIKEKFDENFEEYWHVIVGSDFAVSLTHNSKDFIFFSVDLMYFCVFRI